MEKIKADAASSDTARLERYDAGRLMQQGGYESFIPTPINHGWTWAGPRIHTLLEEATWAIVGLDAFSRIVPDVDLFIQLHILKEASASSRIEGTRTEIDKAVRPKEDAALEKRDGWREVQSYVQAVREAVGARDVADHLGITHPTAMSLIRDFEGVGLLEETTSNRRNQRYRFTEHLDLFASSNL